MQEKPFSQRVRSQPQFATIKQVFGEDVPLPHKQPKPQAEPAVTHDVPFKPSKPPRSGYNCSLTAYPAYMPCPPKEIKRKVKLAESNDEPPAFRPTYKYKSKPCVSITTNLKNIRKSFPSVFKKL